MLLLKYFKVDFILFSSSVERHYHVTNPYHNGVHAADVTQAMSCFIQVNFLAEFPNSNPVIVNVNVILNFSGRWSKLPTKMAVALGLHIIYFHL